MIELLYIDLFCGAGGTSTGVNSARIGDEQCARVVACVNHDAKAIASHASNHPDALHFTEDIRTLELSPLVSHVDKCRRENPQALTVLWASLECTNFSKAKGGQPRDADSRTLAEHLFRYIEALAPDYIQIENVEEFMSWGDIDEYGKPISRDKGRAYMQWVRKVKSYGYDFEYRVLNAADYGAYTSRKRFFGTFAKKGLPIVFPEPTHSKTGEAALFETLHKWKPVREVLDLEDTGQSIFDRKKPLSDKTLERIYAGLIKFVAGGKKSFLIKYNSVNQKSGKYVPPDIDNPCPTVATQGRLALASVQFLSKQFSGAPEDKNIGVDGPCGTVTTIDHHALVSARFLCSYNFKDTSRSIDAPCPTLLTKDRLALVKVNFIANEYSGGGQVSSIESPNPAVLTNPKQRLVTCKYQHAGSALPNFFVWTENGLAIEVYETDSPIMVKIKEFMAIYWLADITMRMLRINELKMVMGFPEDYVLIGTQADQKKFIGNAVEVTIARVLCETLCAELLTYKQKIA